MRKILFVLMSVSFCTLAQAKTNIPDHFAGLWVYAENTSDWNTICKTPKFDVDSPENAWAIYIDTNKNTMKLDGGWTSEITYFKTIKVNADKTQVTGTERTKILWHDNVYDDVKAKEKKLSKYQLRIDGNRLYINEFLNKNKERPEFVFVKCKK